MKRKDSSEDLHGLQKQQPDKRHRRVKCKASNNTSFYKKFARKYTLSTRAQEVLSTVLEDMIEETLEDARKLAQGTGKEKVAIEDVETAMVNLCQRLQPSSSSRAINIQFEQQPSSHKPSENKDRHNHDNNHHRHNLDECSMSSAFRHRLEQ